MNPFEKTRTAPRVGNRHENRENVQEVRRTPPGHNQVHDNDNDNDYNDNNNDDDNVTRPLLFGMHISSLGNGAGPLKGFNNAYHLTPRPANRALNIYYGERLLVVATFIFIRRSLIEGSNFDIANARCEVLDGIFHCEDFRCWFVLVVEGVLYGFYASPIL